MRGDECVACAVFQLASIDFQQACPGKRLVGAGCHLARALGDGGGSGACGLRSGKQRTRAVFQLLGRGLRRLGAGIELCGAFLQLACACKGGLAAIGELLGRIGQHRCLIGQFLGSGAHLVRAVLQLCDARLQFCRSCDKLVQVHGDGVRSVLGGGQAVLQFERAIDRGLQLLAAFVDGFEDGAEVFFGNRLIHLLGRAGPGGLPDLAGQHVFRLVVGDGDVGVFGVVRVGRRDLLREVLGDGAAHIIEAAFHALFGFLGGDEAPAQLLLRVLQVLHHVPADISLLAVYRGALVFVDHRHGDVLQVGIGVKEGGKVEPREDDGDEQDAGEGDLHRQGGEGVLRRHVGEMGSLKCHLPHSIPVRW